FGCTLHELCWKPSRMLHTPAIWLHTSRVWLETFPDVAHFPVNVEDFAGDVAHSSNLVGHFNTFLSRFQIRTSKKPLTKVRDSIQIHLFRCHLIQTMN